MACNRTWWCRPVCPRRRKPTSSWKSTATVPSRARPCWSVDGLIGDALLEVAASYHVSYDEIIRIALLTSAFFVATVIHVSVGPTSVHLVLNGLVGVLLGWRAGLAIPVALFLQAVLLGHGGLYSLGVNACVFTFPALLGGGLFHLLNRPAWLR